MKLFVLILLLATAFTGLVEQINNANVGWTAKEYPQFVGKSVEELRSLFGKIHGSHNYPIKRHEPQDLPTNFDPRTQWPGCIHAIRDQGKCGSCWAFGSTEALSDRFCIQKKVNVILSPQELVSCDTNENGCDGGFLEMVWKFLEENGVVTDSCFPYSSSGGIAPNCTSKCKDGSSWTTYHAENTQGFKTIEDIMTELYTNGPCEAAFEVYQDFLNYESGVYKYVNGTLLGGHAIKMLGWGVENGEDYWLCANSWGTSWGMKGFFKILKGVDECRIEDYVIAGMAGKID
ncbi:hypothetical protein M0811_07247 [Anaeramoeba ignava]|uniref:Peptidase C1A papain C-terminal domain-containing protein n=1 Tax=Anaeramoeba ignava TaxID=1746090 RepID=A0A9Q0LPT4_ANAIG|nr:hypothetical protein M0811_07247 [Anaeramoeba ignava]